MKTSVASLKERLIDWQDWDHAAYQVGVCLGFWPEFGAPHYNDPWHETKDVFWAANPLGAALHIFLDLLVKDGVLEKREEPDIGFRWNPNYEGKADILK